MIDIWLFFSMNLMVLSLIFHTYLENVVGKESKDISRSLTCINHKYYSYLAAPPTVRIKDQFL
jgi:hypothetical protein